MIPNEPPFTMQFLHPDPGKAVIVERIDLPHKPNYEVHGRTRCMDCDRWCWLSAASLKTIERLEARPMCEQCAIAAKLGPENFLGNATE
jgi:hypothetical protein